jgi:diamine N-acetyltransferase
MIHGTLITLRPAVERDRRPVFEWMAASDLTSSMMGPPFFPDAPVPTWEQFRADYLPYYFDGSRPESGRSWVIEFRGEPVGHLSYSGMDRARGVAELDIWFRDESCCGHGWGPDAIDALVRHLHATFGITEFLMRPSRRNPRAIRAYAKAGFEAVVLTEDEARSLDGPDDYADTVVMRKRVTPAPAAP